MPWPNECQTTKTLRLQLHFIRILLTLLKEQEKKTFSRMKYGGDFCMVSVGDAEDIDAYMRYIENRYTVPANFLCSNSGVDGRMRQILVDWLLHVKLIIYKI
jgi:hypothetical protein